MSRPREFNIECALQQCMEVFWTKGFKATSFEDLTRRTQVKKQSLYCAFDDKRALFLKALALYREQQVARMEQFVSLDGSPLEKLKMMCDASFTPSDEAGRRGCFMVNSALEFGSSDEEVTRQVEMMSCEMERLIGKLIRSGQEQRQITNRHTADALAAHLSGALLGARMMEKSGASPERIQAVLHTSIALILP
ncbi:TetR/AcrR family transcriptional regulator [Paenibacillus sp. S-38]|uniref:TetR/AcrR family transcriptional regulator n=1 Tax=Paenibacillus sp. S-38 TaxID=3416710 RepID=UPI003CF6DED4